MTSALAHITFDCEDAVVLSSFWATALGRQVDDSANAHFASIGMGAAALPRWLFIKVDEPKTAKNRCHIDLETADPEAEVARLVAAGATKVATKAEWGHAWAVMSDPEGNEFCVSAAHSPA